MVIYIDPVTRQRVSYMKNTGDLQFLLKGDSAITEEVEPIVPTAIAQMNQGRSNRFFGTDAGMLGHRLPDLDETGHNKQTTCRKRILRRVDPSKPN